MNIERELPVLPAVAETNLRTLMDELSTAMRNSASKILLRKRGTTNLRPIAADILFAFAKRLQRKAGLHTGEEG